MGVVEEPGMTYNMQKALHTEGFFRIKATPLGANLFLLEELEEGEIRALVKGEPEWVGKWFLDIHLWTPTDVDNESLTWMRCFGLPCHVWK